MIFYLFFPSPLDIDPPHCPIRWCLCCRGGVCVRLQTYDDDDDAMDDKVDDDRRRDG
jgi:hypothetical protein